MARTYYTVLTGYGSQQFASAIASNRPLNVTHFAVGDGNGRAVTPDSTRTTLVREVHRASVSSISLDPRNNRQVIFELTLPETVGGFWIREMGLFDSAGRLIAYANCPDSFKPRLEENSGKIQVLRMILLVSSSNAVTLNVDNRVIWATRGQLTPKKLTATTRNEVQEDGHTHEIERGDTTKAGLMQLTNDTGLESENLGLSAKGGKAIAQSVAQLQQRLNDGLNQKVNKTDISDAVNSESRTTVASSKAVKAAYDKAVEAHNKVDAVAVGATNLLINSGVPYSGSAYRVQYALAEAPAVGEEVVITLWGELGAQRTGIGVYNTHGFSEIARLTKLRDGVYQGKGVWRKPISNNQEQTPNDTHLNVYFYPSTATDNNRINRIQLERGNIGTDWKPNREDIKSDVQKEIRTKFITVRGGSQAVTLDAAKRSDWFREMQIPESGGFGYYVQAFYNSGAQHAYSNFPLSGRFYFTAEVFHSAGFSHVRITYPSQNRVFETAVNFNQEDLMLDWREVVFVKDGVFQGSFKATSELRAGYRLNVERNEERFNPYSQLVDASVDISRGIPKDKVIGEHFCVVKNGENDRAKSVYRTGILTDGNVFTELGQWNAENRYQVPWKSFSKTNNTVIGKTTDNERDRLQVNGTIQATAPEAAANNDQVPTTAWVRNYSIAQSGNQVLNGQLNVGRANEWKKLGFPSGNGEFVWEAHPQASQATPNSVRFNVKFLENGQDARYVSFPEFGTANETVAYRSWVDTKATSLANAKVSKAGDTMTGNLELKVGDYSWINQYNTAGKQARIETLPDNDGNFYKVSQRSNNGQTEYHSAFFPKRGMGKIVAYEDWTISLFEYQKIGNFEIRKYPDGTMIQTCRFTPQHNRFGVQMSNNNTLIWPIAFYETPKVWAQYVNTDSNEFGSTDSTISINHRNSNKTKVVFSVYEVYYNNLEASIDFLAIGRWK